MLLILLENYDRSLQLETESLNSAGSAAEKYAIYNDSLEAALNRQKLAWQELAAVTIDSDFIKFFINIATSMSQFLIDMGGLQALIPIIVSFISTLKAASILNAFTSIGKWMGSIKELAIGAGGGFKGLTSAIFGTATAASVLQASFAALTIILTIVMAAIAKHNQKLREQKEANEANIKAIQDEITSLKSLKSEYLSLNSKADKTENEKERLKAITLQLAEAYGVEKDALDKLNGTYAEQSSIFDNAIIAKNREYLQQTQTDYENALAFMQNTISGTSVAKNKKTNYIGLTSGYWKLKQGRQVEDVAKKIDTQGKFSLDADVGSPQWGIFTGNSTPQETLDFLNKYLTELNKIPEKSAFTVKYIDDLKGKINELSDEIKTNKEIIEKYQKSENYVKFYDAAKKDLAAFQEKLANFESSAGQSQIDMLGETSEALENMLSKYSKFDGATDYINALASAFLKTKKAIEETDYALDFLIKEENEYKKHIEELKKEKETQEKILKIEQARLALQEAKNQKVRIYREGVGFVYESKFSEVQKAQKDLDGLLADYEFDKKLEEYANLTKVYNQAMLDNTTNSLGESLRAYFTNAENLKDFGAGNYESRLKKLSEFLSEKNRLILASGSMDFETDTGGTPPPSTPSKEKTDAEKQAEWDAKKSSVGTYVQNYAGYSSEGIKLELRDLKRRNANGQYNSKIQSIEAFLATGAPKYHTGGIAGVKNFNPSTDIVSILEKGERIFTQRQTLDISKALADKGASNNSNISIGNISLPDVTDAQSFVDALKNISSMANKDINKRA